MPSFSFDSIPLRAMRGAMPWFREDFRHLEAIPFVHAKFLKPLPWPPSSTAPRSRDRIHQALEHHGIASMRRPHSRHRRDAPPIPDQMIFAPSTSPIGRIRPRFRAPLSTGMLEASNEAPDQFNFPDFCNSSSITWWIHPHTPSSIHRCSRRQHVIPFPQAISRTWISSP